MKKITELTDKEVLALTTEELDLMVKFRMAEEGIKILTAPKEPEYLPLPQPTEVGYVVDGFTHKFKDKALADKLSEVILAIGVDSMYTESYQGSNYSIKYIKPIESYYASAGTVKKEMYYTKEVIHEMSEIKTKNEKLKDDFQYDLDEYNNEYERGKEVREEVYGKYNEVTRKYEEMEAMKRKFSEYLLLADHNVEIALNFLKRAYTIDEETEGYILKEVEV